MVASQVSCPQCSRLVQPDTTFCENCGVNLALAAILAEQSLTIPPYEFPNMQLSPEVLVPRLGDYLIERSLLDEQGLQNALNYQEEMQAAGTPKLIGQALVEMNLISREVLDQAITEQIYHLQSALRRANEDLEARVRERTKALQRALDRLSELNQLKSNFISNVSHELRTPLTHLRGYLELFKEGELGALTAQQSDALEVMLKSEDRLEQLIEDLIRFSSFARGGLDIQLVPLDLTNVIADTARKAGQKCDDKGLEFRTDLPKELPHVKADRQKLQWVLLHLLDNAVKFTNTGGRVQLGAQIDGSMIKLYVLDTGIGIGPDKLEEVFEPFHQLDSSSTRRYGGTGLGLAMVRKVLEAHGSDILVRSKEGQGSYFEFALPIVSSQQP